MLGCIDIKIVLLRLEVQRFWNAMQPASLRDSLRVCGFIDIQPSKVW